MGIESETRKRQVVGKKGGRGQKVPVISPPGVVSGRFVSRMRGYKGVYED
jgi:hypothetical protein